MMVIISWFLNIVYIICDKAEILPSFNNVFHCKYDDNQILIPDSIGSSC